LPLLALRAAAPDPLRAIGSSQANSAVDRDAGLPSTMRSITVEIVPVDGVAQVPPSTAEMAAARSAPPC
jgi:hypothetical protein